MEQWRLSKRLQIGLIGAGRIGKRHARTLAIETPGATLSIDCDINESAARSLALASKCERWAIDPYSVVRDPAVDAVVIASSTDTHAPLISAAAEAAKHVLCEKPIALDIEPTDAALEAVERAGVKLQIGFQRRFDKGFAAAKSKVLEGK